MEFHFFFWTLIFFLIFILFYFSYLGRKILNPDAESWYPDSNYLVYPAYTYWTLGYLISAKGAHKLIDSKPLEKLLPVDEYLPIMFDKHPRYLEIILLQEILIFNLLIIIFREDWKLYYPNRNLIALSVQPVIINPTHYTHDVGYISDTEDSNIILEKYLNDLRNRQEL